jgi:hypothetical protein
MPIFMLQLLQRNTTKYKSETAECQTETRAKESTGSFGEPALIVPDACVIRQEPPKQFVAVANHPSALLLPGQMIVDVTVSNVLV